MADNPEVMVEHYRELTQEKILAMQPGRDMDALVGKQLYFEPRIQWWAMDREEKGVFISFDWKNDADEWLKEQSERFPKWVEDNGCHIVRMEIHRNFSESISATWEALMKTKYIISINGHYHTGWEVCVGEVSVKEWEFPLAACKAAVLAVNGSMTGKGIN